MHSLSHQGGSTESMLQRIGSAPGHRSRSGCLPQPCYAQPHTKLAQLLLPGYLALLRLCGCIGPFAVTTGQGTPQDIQGTGRPNIPVPRIWVWDPCQYGYPFAWWHEEPRVT